MIKFALILVLCTAAFAQRQEPGKCPKLNVIRDYEVEKDMGVWYVWGRNFRDREQGGKCYKNVYSQIRDRTLRVVSSNVDSENGITVTTEGRLTFVESKRVGLFRLTLPNIIPSSAKYTVSLLADDYENLAVYTICEEKLDSHVTYAIIETRQRVPSRQVIRSAIDILRKNGIDRNTIETVAQANCDD